MLLRWILGAMIGTAIIALTSPWWVRSYLPRQSNRGVLTLPAGETYRWRSEGYASSRIGQQGMVGWTGGAIAEDSTRVQVALWGDSQAEGVCVHDRSKIFSLANRLSRTHAFNGSWQVLPLARSGDDGSDWLHQIPFVESELGVTLHVFLIVEPSDLAAATHPYVADVIPAFDRAVPYLPDFVIHAARNLITDSEDATVRRLRFTVGPVSSAKRRKRLLSVDEKRGDHSPNVSTNWDEVMARMGQATDHPMVILYAPSLPLQPSPIGEMKQAARAQGALALRTQTPRIRVVDLSSDLLDSAKAGQWPHGFHNGRMGSGHLNETGNRIVAQAIAEAVHEACQGGGR